MVGQMLKRQQTLIVDGGLATELERRGADLRHELWSAKMLVEDPGMIRDVHFDFLEAGADFIVSASYQASLGGFEHSGLDRHSAAQMIRRSVDLAREARDEFWSNTATRTRLQPRVAASVGPYGACLADGSEYSGDYGLSKRALIAFHRPRMEILADSGADILAFETIPSRLEAEALLELLNEFPGQQAWLSFSCRDGARVCHGEAFSDCAELAAAHPQIAAVGVNCTSPDYVVDLLRSAFSIAKPLIAYPNSGEAWDAAKHEWAGEGAGLDATSWVTAGARLVGGCCRVGPGDISAIRASVLSIKD